VNGTKDISGGKNYAQVIILRGKISEITVIWLFVPACCQNISKRKPNFFYFPLWPVAKIG
jgi:hypothetical protein